MVGINLGTHHIQGHGSVRNGWILVSLGARAAWREVAGESLLTFDTLEQSYSTNLFGVGWSSDVFEII